MNLCPSVGWFWLIRLRVRLCVSHNLWLALSSRQKDDRKILMSNVIFLCVCFAYHFGKSKNLNPSAYKNIMPYFCVIFPLFSSLITVFQN